MRDTEGYLKPEEVGLILKACADPQERLLITLLWRTGGRVSEVLALRKRNIDFKEKSVTMPTLKRPTPQVRTIPLDSETFTILVNHSRQLSDDAKILEINRFKAWRLIQKAGKRVGIESVGKKLLHPHTFRHSFAIHGVKEGVPLSVMQQLLGHSTVQTTIFYQKFSSSDVIEYVKKMWK